MPELEKIKEQLDVLYSRKTELATMCRIEQMTEIRAKIKVLKERLDSLMPEADQQDSSAQAE